MARSTARLEGVGGRPARQRDRDPIPYRVADDLAEVEAATARAVGEVVSALNDSRDPVARVYRQDEDLWAARAALRPYPASWWRMVIARATAEVPGVEIVYA